MDNPMDEMICPHCGKANLLSDRFCHYCQSPLVESKPESTTEGDTHEEEVPEWLKRIRELKRIDEEREKDKEKWRQQTLFGQSNNQQKQKANHAEKKPISPHPSGSQVTSPKSTPLPISQKPGNQPKPSSSNVDTPSHPSTPGKNELPEGFQPLSIDEE
jgi:hypothetical protein